MVSTRARSLPWAAWICRTKSSFLTQSCAHAPASAESISHLPRRALSGTSSIFPSFASQRLKSGGAGRCGSISIPESTPRLAGFNTQYARQAAITGAAQSRAIHISIQRLQCALEPFLIALQQGASAKTVWIIRRARSDAVAARLRKALPCGTVRPIQSTERNCNRNAPPLHHIAEIAFDARGRRRPVAD